MYYTHINRNTIDSNRKWNRNDPPIRVQRGKTGQISYGHRCILPAGSEIIYDHEGKILPCGARLVIVSEEKPQLE